MPIHIGRTFSCAPRLVLLALFAIPPADAIALRIEVYTDRGGPPAFWSSGPYPINVDVGSIRLTDFSLENRGDGISSYEFHVTGTITSISGGPLPAYARVIAYAGAHVRAGSWSGRYEGIYVDGGPAADGRLDVGENNSSSSVSTIAIDNYVLTPPAVGTLPPVPFGPLTACCFWAPETYEGPVASFETTLGPGDGLNIQDTRSVSWTPDPPGLPALPNWGMLALAMIILIAGVATLWKGPRIGTA